MTFNFGLADKINKESVDSKKDRYEYLSWKVNKVGASIDEVIEYNKLLEKEINKK